MPFISDTASAIKSRFGFKDSSSASEAVPSVRSSPDLFKSATRDNPGQPLAAASSVRSLGELDDDNGVGSNRSVRQPLPACQGFELCEDPSFWKDQNVQVIIRLRPLSSSEISLQGYNKCVRQESSQTITWTGHPESRFTFDIVADENVSQEKLFKVAGVPMVENCVGGYNSCMFAYGQTGSGKTHTMLGDIEEGTRRHNVNCGMTPRVFEYLFSRIQKEKEARKDEKLRFTCKCSFLEIYNEQILDLLDPSSNNLQIREDIKRGVYVENLKEIEVTSARDVLQQLIQGAANRKVAATNMNHASSRSHSVFTCIIESKWESQGVTRHRYAQLNLVDLAGSERQKSSGAEGERLKEATNINKSLSTLGLVIMNLVSISNGKSLHVPYRDSKLTFLLQDSLGGNSKTTIIANISPANCCSLETLSTLKFAQRAKFIKNNAVVNEDASGDVITMRMQVQQLKKEVSRLRSLVSGEAEKLDSDTLAVSFPGSPGYFKWEGLDGSLSPLASDKRTSHKKDYEVALVGAFKREKDKDIALQSLAAENQAAMQLAKQREDEIQGLKMRLRFREAGIKRLEAVASGKISAETHWLKEKEEHLKEIDVLRNQVDRNQEVTRFAMENLRLKEEIRRLKSFVEEGERETMSEQIMFLQNKLLEALDWKLMHESDSSIKQYILIPMQKQGSPWRSSINEENEFLRMQAIQNQAEMETLLKKLDFCLQEKEKLEGHIHDMETKIEEERLSRAMREGTEELKPPTSVTDDLVVNINDQMELKAMVDVIAAASQREAELSKENNDLRLKVKVLLDDNNKLIELYERASSENNYKQSNRVENLQEEDMEAHSSRSDAELAKENKMKREVENLQHQLVEFHEENEKLMTLYEKAMEERDEFKRMLSSAESRVKVSDMDCPEKLVEVDGVGCLESCEPPPIHAHAKNSTEESGCHGFNLHDTEAVASLGKPAMYNKEMPVLNVQDENGQYSSNIEGRDENQLRTDYPESVQPLKHVEAKASTEQFVELRGPPVADEAEVFTEENSFTGFLGSSPLHEDDPVGGENLGDAFDMEADPPNLPAVRVSASEDLNLARTKLETAQGKLLNSAKFVSMLFSLERTFAELEKLSKEVESVEGGIQVKKQQFESIKLLHLEAQERKALTEKKLSALKYSVSNFSSSITYFEQREARARAKVSAASSYLGQKKDKLSHLQLCKGETEASLEKIQEVEAELTRNLVHLKSKLEKENQRQENEKVLFAIDNIDKVDPMQKIRCLGSKATELLKSAEEKTKLQSEIKVSKEKLGAIRREFQNLNERSTNIDSEIQAVQLEIQKGTTSLEEMELTLHGVLQEKDTLAEMREKGKTEIESVILQYHQHIFDADLKEAEIKTLEEEIWMELRRIEDLQTARAAAAENKTKLLNDSCTSCFISETMEEELKTIEACVLEAKMVLGGVTSNYC
ncbi:phragmoplast orienting kinesin 2 isoform X2 [Tripterygium wilfordii]|uniref:Phragmoplast orienting kinesin 2 isoform X2 n=1 Tax=Tripterygium wilfordii TaxID=458696 RepID=A0A7J7DF89_TRIWF|nr:phragmoplast orienting kinesin 2 isoform X2 [Tripterygium wilfordii]